MTQNVKMPDGTVVAFPDEMPADEIGALIEHKFPDAAKSARENTVDASGKIVPVNPMAASTPNRSKPLPGDLPSQVMSGVNEGIAGTLSFPNQVAHSLESIGPTVVNALGGHAAMPPANGYLPDAGQAFTGVANSVGAIKPPSQNPTSQFGRSAGQFIGGALPGIGLEGDATTAARSATNALRAPAAAAKDFNIPLTKGQTSGDLQQITKEEMLRNGGGTGQNVMRNFDASQQGAIANAAGGIGDALGKNPESMRDLVVNAVQNKVAFKKAQATALYDIAADGGITIKPEMVQALPQIIDHSLEAANVVIDEGIGGLTPAAKMAKNVIEQDAGNLTQGMSDFAAKQGDAAVPGTAGITLDGIERLRKKLVKIDASATSPTDVAAVRAVKGAFDDWMQTAVDNMLVSGDPVALDALKQARATSHDYLSITSPDSGDPIGKTVAKLANGDVTAEEVRNWLFGARYVNPGLEAPKVAERIKGIVTPEAWNAVRAAGWEGLTTNAATGEPFTPVVMAKNIETFLNDKGTTLSGVLYSADERAQMQQFADALKSTITPRDAANPSRTAYTIGKMAGNITRLILGTSAGAVTGSPQVGIMTMLALPVFKSGAARKAALKAVDQTPNAPATLGKTVEVNALRGAGASAVTGANENAKKRPVNALWTQGTGQAVLQP